MTSDLDGFALGSGRARPAHRAKALACSKCGGSLALSDERTRVVVCPFCRAQLELTATEARAIGAVKTRAPSFELDIGAALEFDGVPYEVVGRIARMNPDDPEDDRNHDFFLYNPRRPAVWLSSYGRTWWISRRTRVLPTTDVFRQSNGSAVSTHDGRRWQIVEMERSRIAYVDGALPWLACVGDESRHVEMSAVGGSGGTYEAEYSPRGELEFAEGRRLTEADVRAAARGVLRPRPGAALALPVGQDRPRLRAIAIVMMLFGALSLATALAVSSSSERVAQATLPPQGGRVGPITVTAPSTVLEIAIHQRFYSDGWTYIEAEVQDPEGEYLFGFGDELWAESGYDEGAWHEEKNDYDLCVTIPEPGTYYLAFTSADSGGAQVRPGSDFNVTVNRKRGSTVPFLTAGLFAILFGPFLFLIASSKLRSAIAKAAESDD